MTQQKHTPGPWEMTYDSGSTRDIMTNKAVICTVKIHYVTTEEYHANARLIAAAPDLLAALEGFVGAVARLETYEGCNLQAFPQYDALLEADSVARAAIKKATA